MMQPASYQHSLFCKKYSNRSCCSQLGVNWKMRQQFSDVFNTHFLMDHNYCSPAFQIRNYSYADFVVDRRGHPLRQIAVQV